MKKHLLLVGACVWMMLSAHAQNLKLWYQQPAKTWVEALPVGNSSMGAMVYGGTSREELQLNEETLWGGGPYRNDNPKALESLAEVRNLIYIRWDNGFRKVKEPSSKPFFRLPK